MPPGFFFYLKNKTKNKKAKLMYFLYADLDIYQKVK